MTIQTGGNFFVLGLPRSRTAWLANFLTYHDRFCFHEGIEGCLTFSEYIKKLGNNGDSGTCMMMFDMNKLFPNAPKVIIERNPKAAIEYCYKKYGKYNPVAIYSLKEKLDAIDGLRIKYEDIDKNLQAIWEHLIGDGYDQRRAKMLSRLNVQVQDPYSFDFGAIKTMVGEIT